LSLCLRRNAPALSAPHPTTTPVMLAPAALAAARSAIGFNLRQRLMT